MLPVLSARRIVFAASQSADVPEDGFGSSDLSKRNLTAAAKLTNDSNFG